MKLKHRCSVEDCWKCGAVDYGKGLFFCKKHNPAKILRLNKDLESVNYYLKNGKEITIIR